jgi:hypothetical protein
MPIGLGETLMKEYVGTFHPGVCALALGISAIEAVIDNAKNIAIAIAKVLLLAIFIFLSPLILFCVEKKHRNLFSTAEPYLFLV